MRRLILLSVCFAILVAAPASAAISRVQSAKAYPAQAVTMAGVTAGNLLFAFFGDNVSLASATVSGGCTTWHTLTEYTDGTNSHSRSFYCLSATGGSTTVTGAGWTNSDSGGLLIEYSWGGSTGTFDKETGAASASSNPSTSAITPAANNGLVVGILLDEINNFTPTFTGSWTQPAFISNAGHNDWATDQIQTTATSVAVTMTRTGSGGTVMSEAIFLPAAGGGVTCGALLLAGVGCD